ncbi:sialate O-acetylesterase [Pedobacter sp. AW31-3R]|uniref:sialate O-acetylesterase n=1 Tax=Pedobacter sp. AW31-3R TaxID=3445781 RepID=UPI003F9ED908
MRKINTLLFMIFSAYGATAQITLPKLISDGMVLQRDDSTSIWGWASAGEPVRLDFDRQSYHTHADKKGKWTIKLPPKSAGGPYEMVLTASNKVIIKDILFGDVYVCSGQSNMELPMERLMDQYPEEILHAAHPAIRQFLVPDDYNFEQPGTDVASGSWVSANQESILNFSAVAYFFALDIQEKYKIPIGLINAAVGGSPAQSWISEKALRRFPAYEKEMQAFKNKMLIDTMETADRKRAASWYTLLNSKDEGIKGDWKNSRTNEGWEEIAVPGYFVTPPLAKMNGVIWFSKEIQISKTMAMHPLKLLLGRLIDADSVFINGKFAGHTTYQYPPRRYVLPSGFFKEGKNTITVRLVVNAGGAAFVPDKKYMLIAGNDTLDLAGTWKYKIGAMTAPAPQQRFVRWKSGGLFNAMIAPLQQYRIKAVLWYQGEANTGKPSEYFDLMKTLIADWREGWKQGDFPFLYVQLPGYMEAKKEPSESKWAELRAAQRKLQLLPHTAMAVAIDLGEWNDIHPLNKKDVGYRLALQAGHLIYGDQSAVYSGPDFSGMQIKGNTVILSFRHRGKGLVAKNKSGLQEFTIAGSDKVYRKATAEIRGNQVVVWNEEIAHPVSVRYAWADHPEGANLYNMEGLPAGPFETE